jgi:phospholipid/cholesterol/gamma-HCH transport system substrate-binding protein
MNERVMKFRIGVMVLGTGLAAAVLVLTFGGLSSPFQRTYTLYVKLPSASGLSAGAPVRKSGIRIGEVSKIELAADDQVLITLRLNANYRIGPDETCWLRTSLLGDAWLEFEPTRTPDGKAAAPIARQSGQ